MAQLTLQHIEGEAIEPGTAQILEARRAFDTRQRPRPGLPNNVVKSAGRALQILEFFDDIRHDANLIEIARALAYPRSSTSILLRSLVTLGYLEFDHSARTYRPTSRVRLLGSWINPSLFRGGPLLDAMTQINEETGHAVILAARNALHAQYIHVVQAKTEPRLQVTRGTMHPLVASAAGWVFLSKLADTEVAKLVRRANAEAGPDTPLVKARELLDELDKIRHAGYAFDRGAGPLEGAVLAMPLPDGLTQTPLVIAIAGPVERMAARRTHYLALLEEKLHQLKPL